MVCREGFSQAARMDWKSHTRASDDATQTRGADQMKCLLCESDRSRMVWREKGFQIDRCGGCGVLFAVTPPSQAKLNALYEEGQLTGAPIASIGREVGPPPAWKQYEQTSILKRLKGLGACGGRCSILEHSMGCSCRTRKGSVST